MNEIDGPPEVVWLLSLSPVERARFLACLSHNLTVGIRVLCYEFDGAAEAVEPVQVLNEVHHRVSSYLSHYLWGDEDPGWLPVVAGYVLSQKNQVVHDKALQAWSLAKRAMEAKSRD